jgi:hypothetical protein
MGASGVGSLGFTPFMDDIWIMDPHRVTHSDALASIAQGLGL